MSYRMKYVIYCPKCKSEKVDVSVEEPHPKVKKISIDEFEKYFFGPDPAVQKLLKHKVTCENCGYSVEFHV